VAGDESRAGGPDTLDRLLKRIVSTPESVEFEGTSRFEVIRRLGAGGFGVVYLVRDHVMGAEVALKALPSLRHEYLFRLKHEFRALSGLRHENLVSFYELFAQGDQCFFTMEHVPGPNFLQFVRGSNGLDEGRLRRCLAQLVRGLSFLHGAGKLHRDIKPANVLVARGERVVLLDFGLATEIAKSGPGEGSPVAGTPGFMSPEDSEGAQASTAGDWYSVGAMLYQALTGLLPFGSRRADAERQGFEPAPVSSIVPEAPRDLADLCSALLCRDPERRAGLNEIISVLGIGAPPSPAPASLTADQSLVGRAPELARLRQAWTSAAAGTGVTVLVEGASGIGKTALVERFLADAEREGAVVLRGRCYERERVPYQGIDALVDDVCRFLEGTADADGLVPHHAPALVRLFPVLERVPAIAKRCTRWAGEGLDRQDLRRLAFGAFRDLLSRISDRCPLVLHIDDLQWGDVDTAALLLEALRSPDPPRMLLLLSFRSESLQSSPCLRNLLGGSVGSVVEVGVEPLADDDAESLLRRHLRPDQATMNVARRASDAGGNPFFLLELARYLARQVPGAESGQGVDLNAALRERVAELRPDARALLEAVAVAGHPIPEAVARRICSLAGSPWDAWSDLVSGHLVRFSGAPEARQAEPFHDRIREVVTDGLPSERVVGVHLRLAAAFEEARDADPEVLARHHAAAGAIERAQVCAVSAAAQAEEALAFERAARMFQWALELTPERHPDRQGLRVGLARSLANAGRGIESARAYLEASAYAALAERNTLRCEAALQLLISGRIDEGTELATAALKGVGLAIPTTPRRALVSLVARTAYFHLRGLRFRARPEEEVSPHRLAQMDHLFALAQGLSMADVVRGGEAGIRYLLLALSSGESARVARGLATMTGHWGVLAPWSDRTRASFARMERLVAEVQDPRAQVLGLVAEAAHAQSSGPWLVALEKADAAHRFLFEARSARNWEYWTTRIFGIWALFYLGRWRELAQRVDLYLAEARDRGNAYASTAMRMPFGLASWIARGDVAGAREQAAEAVASWSVRGFQLQHCWFLLGESLVDLYEGRGADAWNRVCERWSGLSNSMLLQLPLLRTQMLHLRGCCAVAAAAERRDPASRRAMLLEAARVSTRLRWLGSAMAVPLGNALEASVACAEGREEEAARRLSDAVEGFEKAQMAPYEAAARVQAARWFGGPRASVFMADADILNPPAVARMLVPMGAPGRDDAR